MSNKKLWSTILAGGIIAGVISIILIKPQHKEQPMQNALLQRQDHPAFNQIKPEQFEPAIDQLITLYKQVADNVVVTPSPNWGNAMQPLEEASEAIDRVWNVISHLNSVKNTDEIRQAYEIVLAKITAFSTENMHNEKLYQLYVKVKNSAEFVKLKTPQQTIIKHAIRDFELAGINLPAKERERFKQIEQRLSELSNKFSNNVLDAAQNWNYQITADNQQQLAGLPEHTISLAKSKAEKANKDGWLLSLDAPCYQAVMTYADDASLRETLYEAYSTRASDQGPLAGSWDNSPIMAEILQLRQEQAKLVKFANYAEYSLATKMAKDPAQVIEFLTNLVTNSKPQAVQEYQQLQVFVKQEYKIEKLNVWDLGYYSEKYKQANYKISDEQIRPYFPEQKVLTGMFDLVKKLYGITISEITEADTWDQHVRVFAVKDQTGAVRGKFYADLYARDQKRSGAWMADLLSRLRYQTGEVQVPIAFLVANLTPPLAGKPALLSHDEIVTLFHEFGHTLHHILTKVDYMSVSGINGVAWDAVELPSQFMENWCWEWEVVKELSAHYQTQEPLPKAEFDKLYATKNYQAALAILRQLQFALFDFRIHLNSKDDQTKSIRQILDEVRADTSIIPVPKYNSFQHSFSHIFAGGYSAGYYSYLWAEVLSSDAFEKFKENGTFNPEIGKQFLTTILEQGGSKEAMELYIDFRGREPIIDALLKHRGIR